MVVLPPEADVKQAAMQTSASKATQADGSSVIEPTERTEGTQEEHLQGADLAGKPLVPESRASNAGRNATGQSKGSAETGRGDSGLRPSTPEASAELLTSPSSFSVSEEPGSSSEVETVERGGSASEGEPVQRGGHRREPHSWSTVESTDSQASRVDPSKQGGMPEGRHHRGASPSTARAEEANTAGDDEASHEEDKEASTGEQGGLSSAGSAGATTAGPEELSPFAARDAQGAEPEGRDPGESGHARAASTPSHDGEDRQQAGKATMASEGHPQGKEARGFPASTLSVAGGGLVPPQSVFSVGSDPLDEAAESSGELGLQCETCNVQANSEMQLAIHLEGKKHKRHLAISELEQEEPLRTASADGRSEEELRCDMCNVTAPSAQHHRFHIRGQKHQRREKQHQLMDASAEIAADTANLLLEDEEDWADVSGSQCETDQSVSLGSVFTQANLAGGRLNSMSSKVVRFSGQLDRLMEAEGEPALPRENSLALLSSQAVLMHSGGSFSVAAAHYCNVCGIIATSQANLEDHLRGRRHARRLQYLSHMGADAESAHRVDGYSTDERLGLLRQASQAFGEGSLLRFGSITLPSSMDLRHFLEDMQHAEPAARDAAIAEMQRAGSRQLNKTLSNRTLSWDSTMGLHCHTDEPTSRDYEQQDAPEGNEGVTTRPEEVSAKECRSSDGEEPREERTPKEQPRCEICGISTTSQAHLEAHNAGRKHRRRVESASGRMAAKRSPHYCSLCDISTTSDAHLKLHLVGRAHRRRARAAEGNLSSASADQLAAELDSLAGPGSSAAEGLERSGRDVSSSNGTGEYACGPCGVSCGTYEQLQAHQDASHRRRGGQYAGYSAGQPRPPFQPMMPKGMHGYPGEQMQRGGNGFYGQGRGHQRPMQRPQGAPRSAPYSMGFYPPPYFPGAMPPFPIPAPGAGGYFPPGWWPQAGPSAYGKHAHNAGMMPPFPGPMAGYDMAHMPGPSNGYVPPQGMPVPMMAVSGQGNQGWVPSANGGYNCEVCNVESKELDDYRQHLRGKQHLRRLHNPSRKD